MSKTDETIAAAVAEALENQDAAHSAAQKQMLAGGILALGTFAVVKRTINRRAERKAKKLAKEAKKDA